MQHRHAAGFLVGLFIVLGILGFLASIAIPHALEMAYHEKARDRATELLKIQLAVDEMLHISYSGELKSIGPVADLNLVRTTDADPLVLSEYLPPEMNRQLIPGCTYSFTSDGIVLQMTN